MAVRDAAFWRKSQRDMIGNGLLSDPEMTMDLNEKLAWAAFKFQINGEVRGCTVKTADTDTVPTQANFTAGLHANNPALTVSNDYGDRIVRQNWLDLSVAALSHVYCIITVSLSGITKTDQSTNINSTLKLHGHFYAGEIVLATETAKRPELDLSDEAVVGEIYYSNTTSGALAVGAATTAELMGGGTISACHIKSYTMIPSL